MKSKLALIALTIGCMHCGKAGDKPSEASKSVERGEPAAAAEKKAVAKKGVAVHCDQIAELGYCTETPYASPTWEALGEDALKERCSTGAFGKDACVAEGRVGACTSSNGEVTQFYSTGSKPRTADEASAFCTDMFSGSFKSN